MPSYLPVMQFASYRPLREQLYRAYVTRASEFGPAEHDNTPLISEIHALRQEGAQLLGFGNFSEESLATKMAGSPAEVMEFLHDLATRAKPVAQRELATLRQFAHDELKLDKISTKAMAGILDGLEAFGRTLVVLDEITDEIRLSSRNIPGVALRVAPAISVRDVLNADKIVMTKAAAKKLEEVYTG